MTAGLAVRSRLQPASGGAPRGLRRVWALAFATLLAAGGAASAAEPAGASATPPRAPDRIGAAAPVRTATALRSDSVALDFPRGTGAALVRRGVSLLAVFDSAELRNPEALRHLAAAHSVEVQRLPQALLLVIPATHAPALGLARGPAGWVLGPSRPAPSAGDEAASLAAGPGAAPSVAIAGVPPSRVVVLRDPESGLPLLVGTTREPGRASPGGRRTPEYDLLPTELGVAVLARSESLQLSVLPDRFLLSGSVLSPLPLDRAALSPTAAASMIRCLGLPDLPPEQLLARLRAQSAQLAAAEPLARATQRRALAATMLALGLGHEAQAEMRRAAAEDAGVWTAAEGRALAAAASLLAGRVEEASAAFRPEPAPGCDELPLWRSLFLAQSGEAAAALPGLQAALPLLLSYPALLRERLLPTVADALAQVGRWDLLRGLLADESIRARLPLAAAMLAEADGDAEHALAGYDALARGRDRKAGAVALRRAVELRLERGLIDHAAAARAYAPALLAWRGDAAEREARMRLAQLMAAADDTGAALALLRQTATLFPDTAAAARREAGRILRTALDTAPPLAAVAAFQVAAEFVPAEDREVAEARLVDLLVALDLPARAAALLNEAAARTTAEGGTRAEIGSRLAALRLGENDPAGAQAALDATEAPDMAEALRARRAALAAEIAGRSGNTADAALGRRDWAAAAAALARRLEGRLPAAPAPLAREQQESVLRLAAALVLAGDEAALAALRTRVGGRMGEGPHAAAFARLFAGPQPSAAAAARTVAGLAAR